MPQIWYPAGAAGTLVALLWLGPTTWSHAALGWSAIGLFGLGLVALAKYARMGPWSFRFLFFLVFGLFHFGLTPYWATNSLPNLPRSTDYEWFTGAVGKYALWICMVGAASYIIGATMAGPGKNSVEPDESHSGFAKASSLVGSAVLIYAVASWLFAATSGGLSTLWATYGEFLARTEGQGLGLQYSLMAIGLSLALNGSATPLRHVALALFAGWAVIALGLGLRGEVLFAGAVGAATLARHVRLPRGTKILVFYTAILVIIAFVRQYRSVEASEMESIGGPNPLHALAELGSTIRVVATVVMWRQDHEPFRSGDTYVVSIMRFFEALVAPERRPPAQADYRLFNVEIGDRAGQIGGSVVGEAYHNFGLAGVVLIMLAFGLLMGSLDASPRTRRQIAVAAVIAAPIFVHVRNSFVPVVPGVALGLVFVLLAYILGEKIDSDRQDRTVDKRTA